MVLFKCGTSANQGCCYFHCLTPNQNFEHASHVTMSVTKLLSRIVSKDKVGEDEDDIEAALHDHTYGITSDPLTHFACIFSALIHGK